MKRKATEISMEEKAKIFADYQNREIKAHDIPPKYNIAQHTLQEIVLEMGGELRVPKNRGKRMGVVKTCGKCNRKVELKGAKFCPYCANDLRSQKELLVEKIEKIKALFPYIPENNRDMYIQTLCEVIDKLTKGE